MAPASPITRTTTLLPQPVVVSPSDRFRGGLSRGQRGCGSSKNLGRIRMSPTQGLIPRRFLQSDIIVSGQGAGDSFLVPVAAMVTVRRGSRLHNSTVLSNPGLVMGNFDL